MPKATCNTCGAKSYHWRWEEAFLKFGFGDGDCEIQTDIVVQALERVGLATSTDALALHNVLITSIRHKGKDLIPATAHVGYDDPRDYLPKKIVRLLDKKFPNEERPAS